MEQNTLRLQPDSYYDLQEELIFFIGPSVANRNEMVIDELKEELFNSDSLIVCEDYRDDMYQFFLTNYVLCAKKADPWANFQVTDIKSGKDFNKKKGNIYTQRRFTIILRSGSAVVIDQEKESSFDGADSNFNMDEETIDDLIKRMGDHFTYGDEKDESFQIGGKFSRKILNYVKDYTEYEKAVESDKATNSEYIFYNSCEAIGSYADNKVYQFVSESFDPESEKFGLDTPVAVETNIKLNDEKNKKINGFITDRQLIDDGVLFKVSFNTQFDHEEIPESNGIITLRLNDTQYRVRNNTYKAIKYNKIKSDYMYKTFEDFSTTGYTAQEGWEEFEKELNAMANKPNKSQMEAIKKGIETDDIQLVLGPPGTGKTTVIVSWIKYYISTNKRVLISSQNNSAVDNVIERIGTIPGAKIIRLGNKDKVQDNCRRYLPEEQTKEMFDNYHFTINKNLNFFIHDRNVLNETIFSVEDALLQYNECLILKNKLIELQASMIEKIKSMHSYNSMISSIKDEINNLYESIAQKNIYLLDTNKRNLFVKLSRFIYTRQTKKEIKKSEKRIKELFVQHNDHIIKYNNLSSEFRAELKNPDYINNKNIFKEKISRCPQGTLEVNLQSEYKKNVVGVQMSIEYIDSTIDSLNILKLDCQQTIKNIQKAEKALSEWVKELKLKRNDIMTNILLKSCNVVGATCIKINADKRFENLDFDVSIIDEAGQIQVHNVIVPMTRAKKNLLLGDHLQIPPIANEDMVRLCKTDNVNTELLEKSFFEYLFDELEKKDANTPNITRLNEQFRMPGNISDVISGWFYNDNYHARYNMGNWKPWIPGSTQPLIVISTSSEKRRAEDKNENNPIAGGPGYCNELEAKIAIDIVESLIKSKVLPTEDSKGRKLEIQDNIGIISAYGKQVRYIQKMLAKRNLGLREDQIRSIAASLDSFQGQERPIIIYSSTRSQLNRSPESPRVGFMKELRRLNVAFTRCQKQLVIIGDMDYLTSCEYEEIDQETGEVVPNKSEKKYSQFMQKILAQSQSDKGNYFTTYEFNQALKGNR